MLKTKVLRVSVIILTSLFFLFIIPQYTLAQSCNTGDGNGDGKVDGFDYVIWWQKFNQNVSGPANGDFNCSGKVDGFDYVIWWQNFGTTPNSPTPTTGGPTPTFPPPTGVGVWISQSEIMVLPTSGIAWNNLTSWANQSISSGEITLNNQDSDSDQRALAKALVCARTGQQCSEVVSALNTLASKAPSGDRTLAWGRNLSSWVIAADIVTNSGKGAGFNVAVFKSWANNVLTTPSSGGETLIECHEQRSNNWSTMCGGSRIAVYAFVNDTLGLKRTWDVFRGYVGDRSGGAYAGFSSKCTNWRCPGDCDESWINPKACTKFGHNFDGILPQEVLRQGEYDGTWPPPLGTTYPFNGFGGLVVQAEILGRRGYPSWTVADTAMLRAYSWMIDEAKWNVTSASKATWIPWVINKRYSKNYPAPLPAVPGQNIGFGDWTHSK